MLTRTRTRTRTQTNQQRECARARARESEKDGRINCEVLWVFQFLCKKEPAPFSLSLGRALSLLVAWDSLSSVVKEQVYYFLVYAALPSINTGESN